MNDPPGVAIGGEIDEDAYPALVEKLGELARGRDEVHVDLTAVQYCDLAGLRAIVRAATTGRTVVLHGLPEQLQTILGILGWDSTLGLVIDNSPSGFRLPPANPGRSGRLRQHEKVVSNRESKARPDSRLTADELGQAVQLALPLCQT